MKPIHNLLRERLYRTQKSLIEHPPIDLLSAFSEKALNGSDRAPVLQHLAHCADCREIVFLASPEVISAVQQGSRPPSAARWISWPVLRWGTVAACAVIVVAAVRLRPSYRPMPPQAIIETQQNQQPSLKAMATSRQGKDIPSKTSVVEQGLEPTPGRRIYDVPGKAKAVPRILSLPSDDSFYRQMSLLSDAATDTRRPPPRWTLTADGTVQRSLDGGISWKQIHVARDHVFRAVAAAGRSVWLGGQKGILFRSADAGRHWTQMKPTTDRPLPNSDIIGIEFDDELHGKLTTASNESWITSDAGRTWEKR